MVNAESLSYENIIAGLLNGNFYSSTGPTIKSLVLEDNKVKIKCSKAKQISMSSSGRYAKSVIANQGEYLTSAEFELRADMRYFRLDVIDENGKRANTQAYETNL